MKLQQAMLNGENPMKKSDDDDDDDTGEAGEEEAEDQAQNRHQTSRPGPNLRLARPGAVNGIVSISEFVTRPLQILATFFMDTGIRKLTG